MIYVLGLDEKFQPLLMPGVSWRKKTRSAPLRGYTGVKAVENAANLELFLGQIANFAPMISRNTIVKNSTSLTSIWEAIRLYYGTQSNGTRFLDLVDIKFSPGTNPEPLFQELEAFIEDNLLTADCGLTH